MKQGQLSRADLLAAIIKKDHQAQETLARELCLTRLPEQKIEINGKFILKGSVDLKTEQPEDKALYRSPTVDLSFCYWQLIKQKNIHKENNQPEKQKKVSKKVAWRNRSQVKPAYPALTTLKDVRKRLFPVLNRQEHGKQIDIPLVIDKLSRAECLNKFPRKHRQCGLQSLQIIDDRQLHLTPYWLDHVWLSKHLYDEFADYQITRAVLQNGADQPRLIRDHTRLLDYQLPPANTPVLLLSDLGRLSNNGGSRLACFNRRQKQYMRLIGQLLANDCPVIVLTPCHPKDYPYALRQQIHLVSWENQTKPLPELLQQVEDETETEGRGHNWLELLRTLVSPVVRLEPQLLRSLRQGLRQYGYAIPAAVESLFWQHPDVKEPHNIAATLDIRTNKEYRKLFSKQQPEVQALALRTIKQWRADLPSEIWFEEVLGIEAMLEPANIFSGDELEEFQQDVAGAVNFLQQTIDQNRLSGNKAAAYRAWVARLETRITDAAVQRGKGRRQFQTVFQQLAPGATKTSSGHAIDPDLVAPTNRQKQTAWLCQYGNQLAVTLYSPTHVPRQNTSIIAPLEYQHPYIKVTVAAGETYSLDLPSQGLSRSVVLPLSGSENLAGVINVKTDHTELFLQAVEKPAWAVGIGRDAYGLFADMELAVTRDNGTPLLQRFRWIAAGEFMMGSPEDEKERLNREDYHSVTLTRGYWLADTAVTQAVWQAVTAKNPSHFTGEQNPVETVSWHDADAFSKLLNKELESTLSGLMLRLPTEAEWEHACRAGTDTPFSFGDNITPEQVNYNGKIPYADGEKGVPRHKTVPVKSLPANPWGLYEMHGNVREWCADGWQENLGAEPVVDPYQEIGAARVLRGGSWINFGRGVRSAYRHHYSPAGRYHNIGFRLALGHVSSSRGSEG